MGDGTETQVAEADISRALGGRRISYTLPFAISLPICFTVSVTSTVRFMKRFNRQNKKRQKEREKRLECVGICRDRPGISRDNMGFCGMHRDC